MRYGLLYLKGLAMGLADLVPGISGGTIAVLTGIYQRLITALAKLNWRFLIALVSLDLHRLKQSHDIVFLLVLASGILSGIIIGAPIIHHLLDSYRPLVYAFFAGLICASLVTMINKNIRMAFFFLGVGAGLLLLVDSGLVLSFTLLNIFLAGSVAICAMILPGISGSFILLVLGIYQPLLGALVSLDIVKIVAFVSGALIGLLLFSRLIHLMLRHYHNQAMSLLLGMIGGSLASLWPWQKVGYGLVSPFAYTRLAAEDNYLVFSCILFIFGCAIICLLNLLVPRRTNP